MLRVLPVLLFLGLLQQPSLSIAQQLQQVCVYEVSGKYIQVSSLDEVPEAHRSVVKCFAFKKKEPQVVTPEDITLKGLTRKVNMSSSIGRVSLRWPRTVEKLFGKTPERAVVEATRAVSRALKQSGFPYELSTLSADWQIVFLDEDLPVKEVPHKAVTNCHPAWAMPPANIYVVGQRVASGCKAPNEPREVVSKSVADSRLIRVLVHEFGHIVEFTILKEQIGSDVRRAEGFATWFEQHASDYSPLVEKGKARAEFKRYARAHIRRYPKNFPFTGTIQGYARVSMYFSAIESRARVRGILDVYDIIKRDGLSFKQAIKKRFGWGEKRLEEEVRKVVLK